MECRGVEPRGPSLQGKAAHQCPPLGASGRARTGDLRLTRAAHHPSCCAGIRAGGESRTRSSRLTRATRHRGSPAWCPRRESNPHAPHKAPAPQAGASTCSATRTSSWERRTRTEVRVDDEHCVHRVLPPIVVGAGAAGRVRTGGLDDGNVALCQLSYNRLRAIGESRTPVSPVPGACSTTELRRHAYRGRESNPQPPGFEPGTSTGWVTAARSWGRRTRTSTTWVKAKQPAVS